MNDRDHGIPSVDSVAVCHPEPLVAAATAAVLRTSGTVRSCAITHTLSRLLSCLDPSVQVAVVSDAVDEDIAELFEALRYRNLATPVVIVAEHPTPDRIAQAIELGAYGLVPVTCTPETLRRTVVAARNGRPSLALGQRREVMRALQSRQRQRYQAQRSLAELSGPERQVLSSLVDGTSVTNIAERMSISPRTVRSHVRRLGIKLGTSGQLRIAAAGRGLLAAASSPGTDAFAHSAGHVETRKVVR